MKTLVSYIEKYVSINKIDHNHGLSMFLDYLIDMFDYKQYQTEDGHRKQMQRKQEESPELFKAATHWVELVKQALSENKWLDAFGLVYESMYQSKSKAGNMGQFFTPIGLSDLLSTLCEMQDRKPVEEELRISDSACGSGRLLISHFMVCDRKDGYYVGEDLDPVSVKMCALNLMIHGMRGRVVCHDTLMHPLIYDFGYEVNEVRYPYPAPFFSLREIRFTQKDLEKRNEEVKREHGDKVRVIKEGVDGDMLVPLWESKTKEPEIVVEADGQTSFF